MRTFLAWAIANLEMMAIIILMPFVWFCLSSHPDMCVSGYPMWGNVLFVSFIIAGVGGWPIGTGFFADLLNLLVSALGATCLMLWNGMSSSLMTQICVAGSVGLVAGLIVAVFAVSNFYEVVSLRWLYANSNAARFEESACYGFSRFCLGFHLGVYSYALIV